MISDYRKLVTKTHGYPRFAKSRFQRAFRCLGAALPQNAAISLGKISGKFLWECQVISKLNYQLG